ncbi:MAG: hypothetical protein KDA32_00795 [Phycisphaerales bacterium]|nr:hypothetical protein [Phycisphaerales bacterium]
MRRFGVLSVMAVGFASAFFAPGALGQESDVQPADKAKAERIPDDKLPQAEHVKQSEDGKLEWERSRRKRSLRQRATMARHAFSQTKIKGPELVNPEIERALRVVPREPFLPNGLSVQQAHDMVTIALTSGQVIPHPYVMCVMLQALAVAQRDRVLVVSEGQGYGAALVNELTPYVFVLELDRATYDATLLRLRRAGYPTIEVGLAQDVTRGWKAYAPYDAILVMSAATEIPSGLWDQLVPGGRMVIPLIEGDKQKLMLVTKGKDGARSTETLLDNLEAKFGPIPKTDDSKPE